MRSFYDNWCDFDRFKSKLKFYPLYMIRSLCSSWLNSALEWYSHQCCRFNINTSDNSSLPCFSLSILLTRRGKEEKRRQHYWYWYWTGSPNSRVIFQNTDQLCSSSIADYRHERSLTIVGFILFISQCTMTACYLTIMVAHDNVCIDILYLVLVMLNIPYTIFKF